MDDDCELDEWRLGTGRTTTVRGGDGSLPLHRRDLDGVLLLAGRAWPSVPDEADEKRAPDTCPTDRIGMRPPGEEWPGSSWTDRRPRRKDDK